MFKRVEHNNRYEYNKEPFIHNKFKMGFRGDILTRIKHAIYRLIIYILKFVKHLYDVYV